MSVSPQKHVASEALAGPVPVGRMRLAESLVLLTHDESLTEALSSVVPNNSLIIVADEAALGAQLLSAQVGVVFIDATVTAAGPGAIAAMARRLHEELPDIVLVIAGDGAAQAELARLVADGTVYRFAHKPVSAQRAKLFIDAAWRKRDGAVSGDYPALPLSAVDLPAATPRAAPWLTPALGLAIILAAGAWYKLHQIAEPAPLAPVTPAVSPIRNAAPPVAPAIARDTKTADLNRLATAAEQALLADNLEEAKRLTEAARAVDPNHVRVKFLNAQIAREQARVNARHRAAAAALAAATTDTASASAPGSAAASAPAPVIAASATTAFNPPSSTPPASEARDPNSIAAVILHRVYSIDPEFPEIAREQDLSGYVDLEFTVRADGTVTEVTVLKARPVGVFEKSAVAAVSQWRYQPIERDGQAVDGHARLRLNFGYK